MKQAADHPTTPTPRVDSTPVWSTLGKDAVDTAWRIAVPVILGAVGGLLIDRWYATAPWATLLGTVLGFASAGLLIKKQIAAIESRESQ